MDDLCYSALILLVPIFRPAGFRMVFFFQFKFFEIYTLFKDAVLKLTYRRKKVYIISLDEQKKSIHILMNTPLS